MLTFIKHSNIPNCFLNAFTTVCGLCRLWSLYFMWTLFQEISQKIP